MKRFIAPIAVSAALALTACGGGSSSHASSAAKAASSGAKKSASSQSTSSSTPTSTADFIDDVKLADFSEKLGCGNITFIGSSSLSSQAKAMGLGSMIKCTAGQNTYLLIRSTGAGQATAYINNTFSKDPSSRGGLYVAGPNWAVVEASKSDKNPTRAMVETLQKKIGGDIVAVP